jgi:hypothetical protein
MRGTTKRERATDLDDGEAFLPDPRRVGSIAPRDAIVDMIATDYIQSATSAEEQGEAFRDEVTADELGGPFVEVSGAQEFADHDEDGAELESDDKEPFPTAMRSTSR